MSFSTRPSRAPAPPDAPDGAAARRTPEAETEGRSKALAHIEEWAPLRTAVSRVIDDGRLGKPAFVRCFVRAGTDIDQIEARLAELRAMACDWFGGDPSHAEGFGDAGRGHAVVSLQWPDGQAAILSAGAGPGGEGGGDLIVLGSRGMLLFDIPRALGER